MIPTHHPAEEFLVAYAAGTLPEASSLIVATHMALCPDCRAEVRRLEALGGALLAEMPEAPVADDLLASIFAQLESPQPVAGPAGGDGGLGLAVARRPAKAASRAVIPEPLRGYLGCDLDGVRWSKVIRGVDEVAVPCGPVNGGGGPKVRLMRIRAGTAMPRHTHGGSELTLVLSGGFSDETGHFLRGDFVATDGSVDHQPVADDDGDCICLAVTDAPLRLTGPLGRLINPFVNF